MFGQALFKGFTVGVTESLFIVEPPTNERVVVETMQIAFSLEEELFSDGSFAVFCGSTL